MTSRLLTARDIRALADSVGMRPTKALGQNFVVDPNTIRRIVSLAEVAGEHVVEVGPGFGSLTLGLLDVAASVVAIEVDPVLARRLPGTVRDHASAAAERLIVLEADALSVPEVPGPAPTALVANLPYNVAVPVLLTFLARFPTVARALVLVQAEVAQRLVAGPGSRTYGAPSAKLAWFGAASRAGRVPRNVFWPVPNVESDLVLVERSDPLGRDDRVRAEVFACVDAAFAQRRKTLRSALAGWAGSAGRAERVLLAAGIEPRQRGEQLRIVDFARITQAAHGIAA